MSALHVSNGDATEVPASPVRYWRDALHEGPVPAVEPEELRRIRAAFLQQAGADDRNEAGDMFAERDRALAANRDGEYVLWFEADLYDQLQIVQILSTLAGLGVPPARVTLICIGEYPGIARFGGLGELTAAQLRELAGTNVGVPLSAEAFALAERAWAAFRAPVPDGLRAIADVRNGELRFLGEAFDRLMREYPAVRDGLALTERRLLAAVAAGAENAGEAFVRAAGRETRPFLGDTWAFAMIDRMARGPAPLLSAGASTADRHAPLRLTDAGRRVLAGEADQVALNGVDRWIGGVHLRGRQVPWRWDDGLETIVRSGGS